MVRITLQIGQVQVDAGANGMPGAELIQIGRAHV